MKLVHEVKMEVDSRDEAMYTEKSDDLWTTTQLPHVTAAPRYLHNVISASNVAASGHLSRWLKALQPPASNVFNPFSASCDKLLLFEGFSAILV